MLTSDRDREEAITARELEVKIFLVKPVRQANLIRAVGEMFGAAPVQVQADESSNRKKLDCRVLVVEDNATNQKVIVLRLEKFGCSVDVAANGYEAVQATAVVSFDAILMDCQMPVMDGFEATAQIRQQGGRHIPIIALTANAMDGERERCLASGMDDYLSKPVRADELLKKLQYWLKAPPQIQAELMENELMSSSNVRGALDQFASSMREEGIERDEVDLLFGSFLETSATLMKDLELAIKDRDGRLVEATAHALKGSFATFGFRPLANLAGELEQAGKRPGWDGNGETLVRLLAAYQEAREIVAETVRVTAK
jgi:two-component system sensor histidine kinase/response regulator